MSENTLWWLKMGILFLVALGLWVWLWLQVKRTDREHEATRALQDELIHEMEVYNARQPIPDNKWQDRARRAESLGFIDPDDAA